MSSGPQSKSHASLGYIGQHPVSNQPFPTHLLKLGHRTGPAVKLRITRDFAALNMEEPAPGGVTSVSTSTSLTSTVRPPPARLSLKSCSRGLTPTSSAYPVWSSRGECCPLNGTRLLRRGCLQNSYGMGWKQSPEIHRKFVTLNYKGFNHQTRRERLARTRAGSQSWGFCSDNLGEPTSPCPPRLRPKCGRPRPPAALRARGPRLHLRMLSA